MMMAAGLTLDMAYQAISGLEWSQLIHEAMLSGVFKKRDDLWSGKLVNYSEHRSVLHPALRNLSLDPMLIDGFNVMPQIECVWERMEKYCADLDSVTDVICIGIGGSDLGSRLVCDALNYIDPNPGPSIQLHFVSNIDSSELAEVLSKVKPAKTRVLIISKTFATVETMQNARTVVGWLKSSGLSQEQLKQSLVGITANIKAAEDFGLIAENIFPFWSWVGGRFSVWSAVGLPIAIKFGFDKFIELLAGAHAMDVHFKNSEPEENMPLSLALTLIHNQRKYKINAQAIVPYAHALRLMPSWLQQLEMESHGKCITINGEVNNSTSPVIFGGAGSNSQHSYFQMLHQGSQTIPVDFIAVIKPMSNLANAKEHHNLLIANCLAQAQALANGSQEENKYNSCPGGRPSNLIWLPKLDAYYLGSLLALYEHRALCLGAIWNLNSFDQPGVELGKRLASPIKNALDDAKYTLSIDKVTQERINWIRSS